MTEEERTTQKVIVSGCFFSANLAEVTELLPRLTEHAEDIRLRHDESVVTLAMLSSRSKAQKSAADTFPCYRNSQQWGF